MSPHLSAACRRFLAEALDSRGASSADHAAQCSTCRDRLRAHRQLAGALATKPAIPPSLASARVLEGVFERAAEGLESAAAAAGVAAAMRQPPLATEDSGLFERPALASVLGVPAHVRPDALEWAGMRDRLFASARRESPALRRGRGLVLIGIAASAIAYVLLGSHRTVSPQEIVFLDLDSRPTIEFAIVRGGAPR